MQYCYEFRHVIITVMPIANCHENINTFRIRIPPLSFGIWYIKPFEQKLNPSVPLYRSKLGVNANTYGNWLCYITEPHISITVPISNAYFLPLQKAVCIQPYIYTWVHGYMHTHDGYTDKHNCFN